MCNRLIDVKKEPRCCVCGFKAFTVIREGFDDRYGNPEIFSLVRCAECGHVFTMPTFEEGQLYKLYGRYYPRNQTSKFALKDEAALVTAKLGRLRRWWAGTDNQGQYLIYPGQRMLDVGCGSGVSLLEARQLGAEAFGIETDPRVRSIAEELGLNIHIGTLHDDPFPGTCFDLIVLNQVVEHLPEPGAVLEILKRRLNHHGRLVLSFPNRRSLWQVISGRKWINWHIPYHLHHFDKRGFRMLAERHGLRVVRQKTVTPTLWTWLQLRALRQDPKRGVPNPLWVCSRSTAPSTSASLHSDAGRLARSLAHVSLSTFNRLVDVVGLGDSIVVELASKESGA